MTTLRRTLPRRLPVLLLAAAVLGAAAPPLRAAQGDKFNLLFSDRPGDNAPHADVRLRPTVQQKLFVYVQNQTPNDDEATVEIWASDVPVDGATQTVAVKAMSIAQVVFGKAAPAPPPPAAPPGDKPAPKPQPPAPQEAPPGALQVRVYDKEHKSAGKPADLTVYRPSDYIKLEPKDVSYTPRTADGKPDELKITVKAVKDFAGPKCRVDLVLRPDRIPGLIDTPSKEGTRGGFITQAEGSLTLTASNLEFQKGVERQNGLVYLTIDGWERAYTLSTTFPADAGQPGKPAKVSVPLVRLDAAPGANPGAPYPVGVEVDNTEGARLELGFDLGNGFQAANDEIRLFPEDPAMRPTERRVRMLFSAAGPGGCLLLQPEVQDWKTEWDASNVSGPRSLRVQLIENTKPVKFRDVGAETLKAAPAVLVDEILQTVTLDAAPPQGVTLAFPEKLVRGADLPVQATSQDRREDIKEVLFYLGKPGPDGKAPPTAVPVKGVWDAKNKVWTALLPAPTDQKGKVDVSAEFVKLTNVSTTGTVTVQLVDPGAPGAVGAKGGSIEGLVFQGGQFVPDKDGKLTLVDARPQPNIEVRLLDDKGAAKDAVKTNANGKYLFENVAAGSYKVTAAKTTDSTKGETAVQVLEGKKVVDVYVKLQR